MKETLATRPTKETAPLNIPEWLFFYGYLLLTQLKNPIDYSIGIRSNMILFNMTRDIAKAKVRSRSAAKERRIFSSYRTDTIGTENIPSSGPLIFAANHYNRGPLKGMWEVFAIADVLAKTMPNGFDYRYRLIIDSKKNSTEAFGKKSKDVADQMIESVLHNTALALDFIPEDKPLQAIKTLKTGGIVGVFPTGRAEFELSLGLDKVGRLFELAKKYGTPILPIGTYHSRKEKKFVVNIGKLILPTSNRESPNPHQENVRGVMQQIASLLPSHMRGVYT